MIENLQSASVSDRGLSEKRPQNEDSFLEMPAQGLFAVADGVGGAQAGEVASQMAMEILQEAFSNLPEGGDAEDLMQRAIERANEAIFQMSSDLPQLSSMATTVVALHVDGNIATIGHVGDSRLYRIDKEGNLYRETQDHSMVEEEVRAGRMTIAQAATHPSRNVISRALGAENTVEVDLKTMMFENGSAFLLCSDGITRHIEDRELRELLNSGKPPEEICQDMKHICYGRGAEDNLTAVIVRISAAAAGAMADEEEQTVAAVRPPLVNNKVFASAAVADSSETPTQNLEAMDADNFKTRESYDGSHFSIPALEETEEKENGNGVQNSGEITPVAVTETAVIKETYPEVEKSGSGFFGKFITSLLLLLVGAALGAGGYYYWKQSQLQQQAQATTPAAQETPQITQMQSPNIAYSAFEDNRRNADKNPQQFIAANGNTADSAEDFYLLGRAYLLLEDYKNAWINLDKAKQLLSQTGDENKLILTNEIALAMSIANVDQAKRFFRAERENVLKLSSQNSNSSANTANNANIANAVTDTEIKPSNQQPESNVAPVR